MDKAAKLTRWRRIVRWIRQHVYVKGGKDKQIGIRAKGKW